MKTTFSVRSSPGLPSKAVSDSPPGLPRRARPGPRGPRCGCCSSPAGSGVLVSSATISSLFVKLKLQTGFARRIRQRFDLPVITRAAAVEDHLMDALVEGGLRCQRAERLRAGHIGGQVLPVRSHLAQRRSCRQRDAGGVVNELNVNVLVRKADAHARTFFRAADFFAHAPMAKPLKFLFLLRSHS